MKRIITFLLVASMSLLLLTGCKEGAKVITLKSGAKAFSFNNKEFTKRFNEGIKDDKGKLGEWEEKFDGGEVLRRYDYKNGVNILTTSDLVEDKVTSVVSILKLDGKSDSAMWGTNTAQLFYAVDGKMNSENGTKVMIELGLTSPDKWTKNYKANAELNGISYYVEIDNAKTLSLVIIPSPQ